MERLLTWDNYGWAGLALGLLAWLSAFAGVWWWGAKRYAFQGYLFGWFPAGVAATVVALIIGFGWGLLALGLLLVLFFAMLRGSVSEWAYKADLLAERWKRRRDKRLRGRPAG